MNWSNIFTVVNIIALILALIGLYLLIKGISRNRKISEISTWPKVAATVQNVLAKPANSAAGSVYINPSNIIVTTNNKATYTPLVSYLYNVQGRDYTSNQVVYSGASSYNALETKTLIGNMSAGSSIMVYYNPKNPAESYIYNGKISHINTIIGALLIIAAIFVAWYGNKPKNAPVTDLNTIKKNPNAKDMDKISINLTETGNSVPISSLGGAFPMHKIY